MAFISRNPAFGIVLMATIALVVANSPIGPAFHSAVNRGQSLHHLWGDGEVSVSVTSVINNLAMTAFFFLVGAEIRIETGGVLQGRHRYALAVICAIGGMMVPALIFILIASGTPAAHGWGIPTATDVALAIGALGVVASKVSTSARSFLLTLAVVDDVGGLIILALFYGGKIDLPTLAGVLALMAVSAVLSRNHPIAVLAVLLPTTWFFCLLAGIHPAIVGAVFGWMVARSDWVAMKLPRLEKVVYLAVLPAFALVNAGATLETRHMSFVVIAAVALALWLGKPIGISLAALASRFVGVRSEDLSLGEIAHVSIAGGIGFTVALYVEQVAFGTSEIGNSARIGILAGTLLAVVTSVAVSRARPSLVENG